MHYKILSITKKAGKIARFSFWIYLRYKAFQFMVIGFLMTQKMPYRNWNEDTIC